MVKLICPKCMKSVPVPDDFSGREVTCPACMKAFEVPARYQPAVLPDPAPATPATPAQPPTPPAAVSDPAPVPAAPHRTPEHPPMSPDVPPGRPAPPPGLVPPAPPAVPAGVAPPAPPGYVPPGYVPPATPQLPAGYTRSVGFTISPHGVAWLPAVLLTGTLICTFLPWVGSYVGGYPVYSQGPWRAMFGSVNRNYTLESATKLQASWLDKMRSDWELMVPFMLCLLAATALTWADRGFHSLDPRKIALLEKVWPWRNLLIGLFATLALTLLLVQVSNGFGLERAVRKVVAEEFTPKREAAKGSPSALAAVEYDEEQALGKFNLERTTWLYLGVIFNVLAVAAVIARAGLDRRGNKPPPRIVVLY